MKTKILSLLTTLLLSAATSFAQSGDFGENNAWHWDLNNGTLTINGEGAMPDYAFLAAPWENYRAWIIHVIVGSGATSIGRNAFRECYALTGVTIPEGITDIESSAFSGCRILAGITFPESLTGIGDFAFEGCDNLTGVIIPGSVTSIGDGAFIVCSGLSEIHNRSSIPQTINERCFHGVDETNCTLYVPTGSKAAYQEAPYWREFQNIVEENVSAIGEINPSAIRVYSDPATGSLHIEGLSAPAQVTVINTAGQTVRRQTVADGGNISIAHLPRGVYLIHVNGQTMKIIKN
ncbi:MAG: leucine-rich repeat domain-containing protein [Dysgonamonadaceae bacterium]|nr:leucine-rich repeat domain-containing protein [Dysgonamonadaceae bacterium]